MNEVIRNIGIFAHVDAGKTTLTEQLLLQTGAIRKAGRVDEGSAHTDTLAIERQRGISVRSGTVCVRHDGAMIRIVDTPGHVDFSPEVETALLAVDGAVLVVSAVEGIQAQTVVIQRVLAALHIPTIVFINKTDRSGADADAVFAALQTSMPLPFWAQGGEGALIEALTTVDDALLTAAIEGTADEAAIGDAIARCCAARTATPVLSGAALKGLGVRAVLDGIARWLPPPEDAQEFSAAAYHVRHVGEERQVRVRVFGGELRVGPVEGYGRIRRLRVQTPEGEQTAEALRAGDIGIAVGLDGLLPGAWLGKRMRGRPTMSAPVLRAQVVPDRAQDMPALLAALERMQDEHGGLSPTFEKRSRKAHIRVMGEIHQQVVEQTLRDEYAVAATLMPPEVLFRETPIGTGEGSFDVFFSPWTARGSFRIEPGEPGSGVVYRSEVHTDQLHIKYLHTIEETVYEALQEGLYGWPVTDIVVTLTHGEGSWLMWAGGSSKFAPVVPLGLFAALKAAGIRLLEPVYRFEAQVDEGMSGTLLYELSLLRALCDPTVYEKGTATITGIVPVETSQRFATRVNELSHGRGLWRVEPHGFFPAPEGTVRSIERTTPDPTDQAIYFEIISKRRSF